MMLTYGCVRQRRCTWSCGLRPQFLAVGVRNTNQWVCTNANGTIYKCTYIYLYPIVCYIQSRVFNPIHFECISHIFDYNSFLHVDHRWPCRIGQIFQSGTYFPSNFHVEMFYKEKCLW